jgi:hypothetical protein
MPDFARFMNLSSIDPDVLRGTLRSMVDADEVLAGRTAEELQRAVDDVTAGQLIPARAQLTAYSQMVAAYAALLLRLAGANPSSILNELNSRSSDEQLALVEGIRSRMRPPPIAEDPLFSLEPAPASPASTDKSPRKAEHVVPPRATPVALRPASADMTFVRLEVRPGVFIDIEESVQRTLRKPERREELVSDILERLEQYFGG